MLRAVLAIQPGAAAAKVAAAKAAAAKDVPADAPASATAGPTRSLRGNGQSAPESAPCSQDKAPKRLRPAQTHAQPGEIASVTMPLAQLDEREQVPHNQVLNIVRVLHCLSKFTPPLP